MIENLLWVLLAAVFILVFGNLLFSWPPVIPVVVSLAMAVIALVDFLYDLW